MAKTYPQQTRAQAWVLYSTGSSYSQISRILKVSITTVRLWLNPDLEEANRLKAQKYYKEHREQCIAKSAQYAKKNKEKTNAKNRKWRKKNAEQTREINKTYRRNNPAVGAAQVARRRAKRHKATPPWLTAEHHAWIKSKYVAAKVWEGEGNIKFHVNHIWPLVMKQDGKHVACGLHVPWNLEVIPAFDNLSQGCKPPDSDPCGVDITRNLAL